MIIPFDKPLVFIIEDNDAYRMLIGKVLERHGFRVMKFEHGRKAADMLNYITPSLILSDITMPCMDGFEFHEYVLQKFSNRNIPFIYLSSSTSLDNVRRAEEMGAYHVLDKPISSQKLADTIDNVLKEVA